MSAVLPGFAESLLPMAMLVFVVVAAEEIFDPRVLIAACVAQTQRPAPALVPSSSWFLPPCSVASPT